MGLVNRVFQDGNVAEEAEAMAAMICDNAPLTVDAVKFITNQTRMDESQRDIATCDLWSKHALTVTIISRDAGLS